MAARTAYQCDGPDCEELTTKPAGTEYPPQWVRLKLKLTAGGAEAKGSFHDDGCAQRWLTRQLAAHADGTLEPAVEHEDDLGAVEE